MSISSSGLNPSSDGWRTFDALDVKQSPKNTLKERAAYLDLAKDTATSPLISITAQKIKAYTEEKTGVIRTPFRLPLFPPWSKSTPKYEAYEITAPSSSKPIAEMQVMVQQEVSAIVNEVDYNGLNVVTKFINFYKKEREKDQTISGIEAFHKFQPNSEEEYKTGGTSCVGKAWDMVRRLNDRQIVASVLVESKETDTPVTHAAVAVPCSDGILLVDVELDVPVIPLPSEKPSFIRFLPGNGTLADPDLTASIEIVRVPGNYTTSTPMIVKRDTVSVETEKKKNSYHQLILRPCANPDESVMKRWLVEESFYPVSTGTRNGQVQHAFKIVALNRITFNIGDKKFRIPIDAFDPVAHAVDRNQLAQDAGQPASEEEKDFIFGTKINNPVNEEVILQGTTLGDLFEAPNIQPMIGGAFFEPFKTDKTLLINQIFDVVAHKEVLKNLKGK